jgi:DNA-binding transcriptional MerR regulator
MNARETAKIINLNYTTLAYWIQQGIIQPTGEGKRSMDYEFVERDISLLQLAVHMREDKHKLQSIKDALKAIPPEWQPGAGGQLAVVTRTLDLKHMVNEAQDHTKAKISPKWDKLDNPIFIYIPAGENAQTALMQRFYPDKLGTKEDYFIDIERVQDETQK